MESNHVLMFFRHALNDRTSSGPMMSGNRGTRTHDLLVNSQVLCQLSYVPEYRFMKLSKSSCLLSIREECLFSFYADAAAESKMCDLNASSCSRSMRAAITPHSRKSGRRESNPPYPYRIRLIRPALLPMSYCPETEKDLLSGFLFLLIEKQDTKNSMIKSHGAIGWNCCMCPTARWIGFEPITSAFG